MPSGTALLTGFESAGTADYGFEHTPALNPGCGFPWCPGTHCLSPGPGWSAKAVAPSPRRLTPTVTTTAMTRFIRSPPIFANAVIRDIPAARPRNPQRNPSEARRLEREDARGADLCSSRSAEGRRSACAFARPRSVLRGCGTEPIARGLAGGVVGRPRQCGIEAAAGIDLRPTRPRSDERTEKPDQKDAWSHPSPLLAGLRQPVRVARLVRGCGFQDLCLFLAAAALGILA